MWVASPGPLTTQPGGDTLCSQPLSSLASRRDRKSTGLKFSKKKARRRHTDVRSPGWQQGPQPLPLPGPSLALPEAGPLLGTPGPGTRPGASLPRHLPCRPALPTLARWGCSRSSSNRPQGHWWPPWDSGGLGGSPSGPWGGEGGGRGTEAATPVLSGPKQGVLHPEI